MVCLTCIPVLLSCINFLITAVEAVPIYDTVTAASGVVGSDNTTWMASIEKRMDPQHGGIAQGATGQDNSAYEEAKRLGAKYLELLVLRDAELQQTAKLYKEPSRDTFSTGINSATLREDWTRLTSTHRIPITTKDNEDIFLATCPLGRGVRGSNDRLPGRKDWKNAPNPLSAALYMSAGNIIFTESIYDVVSGGILRVTNVKQERGDGSNVDSSAPEPNTPPANHYEDGDGANVDPSAPGPNTPPTSNYEDGSKRGPTMWRKFESSTIAAEWQAKTTPNDETKKVLTYFGDQDLPGDKADERTSSKKYVDKAHAVRAGLRTVSDPAIQNPRTEPVLLAISNDISGQISSQVAFLALDNAITLAVFNPNAWAVLGAPGNRWFFELLYHWKPLLGRKVPETVKLFKTANNQVGMLWTLIDYEDNKADQVRSKIREIYPKGFGPGGSGGGSAGPSGGKRPLPDGGNQEPPPKKPAHIVQGYSGGTVDLNQGYYGH